MLHMMRSTFSWVKTFQRAELEDVRLHDLRHTHASIALGQGETVPAIGRLLGHQSPDTTLGYIHFADAMVADAAEKEQVHTGVDDRVEEPHLGT